MQIEKRPLKDFALDDLVRALRKSWTQSTSVSPNSWSPEMPSTGQCAITALVLQDFLGGEIKRCEIEGNGSHYWLTLDDGQEVDITVDQFADTAVRTHYTTVSREKLLENVDTASRYKKLLSEVRITLGKIGSISGHLKRNH